LLFAGGGNLAVDAKLFGQKSSGFAKHD
jgi:hypothetical protein